MKELKKIKKAIMASRDIAVASHINPDGDSIGSLLSLGLGMESMGKRVYMVSENGVPRMYEGLPGAARIMKTLNKKVDLAVAVDCNAKEMLGEAYNIFKNAGAVLEIDHHEFRSSFGDLQLIDFEAAAVGELIYKLLKALDVCISEDIAYNILTSIIVETNSFRLPNIRPLTFEICAELLRRGVDFHRISEMVYWSRPREAVLLSGIGMARTRFVKNNKIAWSLVKREDFIKTRARQEDADAVANEILNAKKVEVVAFFREKDKDSLRVSLRSKGRINVAQLAMEYGGGGHFDVAGCVIPNTRREMSKLLKRCEDLLTEGGLYGR